MKALQSIHINRDNAILVIVDVENEFCSPGGKLYNETSARIMPGVIAGIKKLAEQARKAHIPIIYIQSVRTHQEPEFGVFTREPILKIGTWASEIVEEVKPHKSDIVVQKFTHDPFFKPDLDKVLRELVAEPTRYYAIISGGAVNVCAYHTVMGFHLRSYWTIVPVDSVYYMSDASYQRALEQFSESGPYPNVFLSRSDLIKVSQVPALADRRPVPGS